jgi:hypothetical protein
VPSFGQFDPDGFFFVCHFPGSEAVSYLPDFLVMRSIVSVKLSLSIFSHNNALYASSLFEIVLAPILMYVYTYTENIASKRWTCLAKIENDDGSTAVRTKILKWCWCGRRDLNPGSLAWKAKVLNQTRRQPRKISHILKRNLSLSGLKMR